MLTRRLRPLQLRSSSVPVTAPRCCRCAALQQQLRGSGQRHRAASTATINFYRFRAASLDDSNEQLHAHVPAVQQLCEEQGVVGNVILAAEGVNGSLAGPLEAVREVVRYLSSAPPDHWAEPLQLGSSAPELVTNEELFHTQREPPFKKLKVKIKPEIVTMRLGRPLDMSRRGVEVDPVDWDDLIAADDVLLLDTRNGFESAIGVSKNDEFCI